MRFLLYLLLILPFRAEAQTAEPPGEVSNIVAVADSLRAAGAFHLAVERYSEALALSQDSTANQLQYSIASTYALSGQAPDSAFAFLEKSEGGEGIAVLYDPDFFFLTKDPRWLTLESEKLDQLGKQMGPDFDRSYARDLLRSRMNEWGYRWHIMYGFRTYGPDAPVLTALAHAMQENHAENEALILGLLDEKGWPANSIVGEAAAYAAGNIVNHGDLATRQRYLPMIEAACEAGEADWNDYAQILDRTELELGRPQIYGTQMEQNPQTGLFEPRPMLAPSEVDARRAAKGMEPLQDQLDRFNAAMKRDFGG